MAIFLASKAQLLHRRCIVSEKIRGEDLKGLKNLRANLVKLAQMRVKVGVLGGNYPNGQSIASVAALHEFGSETPRTFMYKGKKITVKGIPTRSFLRAPLRAKIKKLSRMDEVDKGMMLEGLKTGYVHFPLYRLGLKGVAIVQEAFDTRGYGQWPANISEEYIELKGSDAPLIDQGLLRQSIASEVYKKGS